VIFSDAREIARMLRAKEVSAREVLAAHLAQIQRCNPEVNAVVTLVADRAAEEAAAADERLVHGEEIGPLHGLPVAHKDTHDTAGIRTTYGSPLLADNVPARDALVVERIRSAGAITIGKTNVPEFAAGSHTVNPVFGATCNPYDLGRSAGGSSGGAAAALACGMHALADGSDMGGSLRNPASFCNVVGLRPSPGRVPVWPTAAPWSGLSVTGPMARTVSDVGLLLSVLAGPDPRDRAALDTPGSEFAAEPPTDVRGLRVALAPDLGGRVPVDPDVRAVIEKTASVFEGLGCAVEPACPDLTGADEAFRTLRAWLFELTYSALLDEHPDALKATLRENILIGRGLTGPDVSRAHVRQAALHERMREFFDRYDVLLAPVSQVPPFPVESEYPTEVAGVPMRDYLEWMGSAYLISVTGCPALSVPAGFTPGGLPVGVQMVGPYRGEAGLLRIGRAFEEATGHGLVRPAVAVPAV
jgi:amidase